MSGSAARGAVRVLSPSAVHSSLEAIVEACAGDGVGRVELTFETAPALARRIESEAPFDVVVAPPAIMEALAASRRVDAGERVELGRAGVGVAAREGAPRPDLASSAALKRSLLEADSIVHTRASSGIYVTQLFERLGVADEIRSKTATYHDATGAFTRLLNGKGREFGFGGIPEIRRWSSKGLRFIGPLPPEVQHYTTYVAALAATPANEDGARAFLRFLAGAAAAAICAANGVERSAPRLPG